MKNTCASLYIFSDLTQSHLYTLLAALMTQTLADGKLRPRTDGVAACAASHIGPLAMESHKVPLNPSMQLLLWISTSQGRVDKLTRMRANDAKKLTNRSWDRFALQGQLWQ